MKLRTPKRKIRVRFLKQWVWRRNGHTIHAGPVVIRVTPRTKAVKKVKI